MVFFFFFFLRFGLYCMFKEYVEQINQTRKREREREEK